MFHSLKLRLALLSALLGGVVMVTCGLFAWSMVYRFSREKVDEGLRRVSYGYLTDRTTPRQWDRAEEGLAKEARGSHDSAHYVFLLLENREGRQEHVSAGWPREIPLTGYTLPADGWTSGNARLSGTAAVDGAEEARSAFAEEQPGPRGRPGFDLPRPLGRLPGRLAADKAAGPPVVGATRYFSVSGPTASWRVAQTSNQNVTLILATDLGPVEAQMRQVGGAFLVALPLALLLLSLGGWLLAQRALRPIAKLTTAAEGITAQGLDKRIPVASEDAEFARLIQVFNAMMDRLQRSFTQAMRFSADAAHELKTPLTILQGELEQAVQHAEVGSEQQQMLSGLLDEVQRLKAITRKLLLLALADAGKLSLHREPVDISELVAGLVEDIETLAPGLRVVADYAAGLIVQADPDLIYQVLQNLVTNAIRYNQEGGEIRLRLLREDGMVRFTIANTGKGIPQADRGRIFDRFYRGDKSRNRRVEGSGLGLSLAREITRAHGGDIVLEPFRIGFTAFTVMLPEGSGDGDSLRMRQTEISQSV